MKLYPLMTYLALGLSAMAVEDPFVRDKNAPAPREEEARKANMISVTYEVFSLSLDHGAALLRQAPENGPLYQELVARTRRAEAKLEFIQIVRGNSGQKQTIEGMTRLTYPTSVAGGSPRKEDETIVPARIPLPVAPDRFKSSNSGFSLETEPVLGKGDSVIDLRLVPDHVALVEIRKWGEGMAAMGMPVYEQQTINTQVKTLLGKPTFVGTISRPPGSKFEANSPRRVWFAFVTVDIAKN